jgi:hypothetical protein
MYPHTHLLHSDRENTRHETNQRSETLGTVVSPYRKYICHRSWWRQNGRHAMALECRRKHHKTWYHDTRTHTPERYPSNKKNRENTQLKNKNVLKIDSSFGKREFF